MADPDTDTLADDCPTRFDPEPWRAELVGYLRRRGAAGEAEDIVQETFLRSVQKPPAGKARPWLYGIAINLLHDHRRAQRVSGEHLPRAARSARAVQEDPATTLEQHDLAARAWQRIASLPAGQRTALRMRIHDQLGYAEIAAALRCTEATARQHFYLGLKTLRETLLGGAR